MSNVREIDAARFWDKVDTSGECWEWQAGCGYGYGKFAVKRNSLYAHRVSMMIHLSRWLTSEECVLHTCDNRLCVNPAHLYIGDRTQNYKDMAERGRVANRKGEANPNAKMTEEKVRAIRREYVPYKVTRAMLAERHGVNIHSVESVLYDPTFWEGVV